jgi:hypothetical protein
LVGEDAGAEVGAAVGEADGTDVVGELVGEVVGIVARTLVLWCWWSGQTWVLEWLARQSG